VVGSPVGLRGGEPGRAGICPVPTELGPCGEPVGVGMQWSHMELGPSGTLGVGSPAGQESSAPILSWDLAEP
jgi:hypothetical protein